MVVLPGEDIWSALNFQVWGQGPIPPGLLEILLAQRGGGTAKTKHTLTLQNQPPSLILIFPARKQSMPRPERTLSIKGPSFWCRINLQSLSALLALSLGPQSTHRLPLRIQ